MQATSCAVMSRLKVDEVGVGHVMAASNTNNTKSPPELN